MNAFTEMSAAEKMPVRKMDFEFPDDIDLASGIGTDCDGNVLSVRGRLDDAAVPRAFPDSYGAESE